MSSKRYDCKRNSQYKPNTLRVSLPMQPVVRILVVGILKLLVMKLQVLVHQFSCRFHREPKVLMQRSWCRYNWGSFLEQGTTFFVDWFAQLISIDKELTSIIVSPLICAICVTECVIAGYIKDDRRRYVSANWDIQIEAGREKLHSCLSNPILRRTHRLLFCIQRTRKKVSLSLGVHWTLVQ